MYAPLWVKTNFSFLEGAAHPDMIRVADLTRQIRHVVDLIAVPFRQLAKRGGKHVQSFNILVFTIAAMSAYNQKRL